MGFMLSFYEGAGRVNSGPLARGCRSGFPSCARRCQYGPWLASSLCGVDRGVLLWGSVCYHVKREASRRFIPSTLSKKVRSVLGLLSASALCHRDYLAC